MKKVDNKVLTKSAIKQFELTAMAVYLLGGTTRAIDTEDIAKKCHELAPTLFSWQKHKDQINLELVRVSLSDAKKQKNGALLIGSGREGWRLSTSGLNWINGVGRHLIPAAHGELKRGQSKAGSIDSVRRLRERDRLLASEAWRGWNETKTVSPRAAREIFRIDEYTTGKMLEIKVARLRGMFEDDVDLAGFLKNAGEAVFARDTQ